MIRDITLGQYFPGDSILHKTDPRIKLVSLIVYFASLFSATRFTSLLLPVLATLLMCAVSRIRAKVLLRSVRPVMFILLFTAIINIFFTENGNLIFHWNFISIYDGGIRNALFVFFRLVALVMGTGVLLSYTTSPYEIADALEDLLSPLKALKVPVHDFATMMSIALRFIPTLMEETDRLISAQKARGADFETGGIIKRGKALIPIVVPLFVSCFTRAGELADAMECRCYNGGVGRTRMKVPQLKKSDFVFLAAMATLLVCTILLNGVILPWPILQ